MKKLLYSLLLSFLIPLISLSQSGTLDPTFGNAGKVLTHFGDGYLYCYAAAIQSDGKIIAGGRLQKIDGSYYGFVLIRYNIDGTIDESFGNNGQVLTEFGEVKGDIHSLLIKPNGQLLALGYGLKPNPNLPEAYDGYDYDVILSCYNVDGALDSTFGNKGKTVTDLGKDEIIKAMAMQSDGKIVATGTSREGTNGNTRMLTIRYMADGTLDKTFGNGGSVIYPRGDNEASAIAVDEEDKIIIGGTYHFPDRFFIVGYMPNGTMDASFGNEGKTSTTIEAGPVSLNSILILKDKKILAAGVGNNSMMTVRYSSNGIIDNDFGTEGRLPITFKEGSSKILSALQQSDGKIILVGGAGNSQVYPFDFAIACLRPDGHIDNEFGDSGRVVTDFGQFEYAVAALQQKDSKVVLVGQSLQYFSMPTINDFALARYNTSQSVLPVTLTKFSAMQNERGVILNWQTAEETNTNYFSVQRSLSNSPFAEIAKVKSVGYSTMPHNYTYIDAAPATGANLYQLKQVDKNGGATYSKAAFVNYVSGTVLRLYPNPARNTITVEGLDAGVSTTISLLDLNGKVVAKQTSIGSSKNTFNTARLAAGAYYLKAESGNHTTTIRFVKE